MMNTIVRLIILVPGAVLLTAIGLFGLGFAGLSIPSVAAAALLIGTPVALIVWTLRDHHKRGRVRNDLNA
jgi:hypothetical protein